MRGTTHFESAPEGTTVTQAVYVLEKAYWCREALKQAELCGDRS
jgi:hypothetical protein